MEKLTIAGYSVPRKHVIEFAASFTLWAMGLFLSHFTLPVARLVCLGLFLSSWVLAGYPVLKNAAKKLLLGKNRHFSLDENFLMSIATIGAFAIGEWEEAAGVMIFFMIGELIQEAAVDKSRSSIKALLALKPDKARIRDGGEWKECPAEEAQPGSIVLVRPGERIPLDGIVIEGESKVDASMLTGESRPVSCKAGNEVRSGTVALSGVLQIRTTKSAGDSSAAKIIALVESAREAKAKPERFITAFARWYTPFVVGGAVLLAVLPPLFIPDASFSEWLHRALILLVISCPCALVVSIPLGYFAGIGGMSRKGIMVKGAVHLDSLRRAKYLAFDKTGTLTKGKFSVAALEPAPGVSEETLLKTAAFAEQHSNHPIAAAIREHAGMIAIGAKTSPEDSRFKPGGQENGNGASETKNAEPLSVYEIAGMGLEVACGESKILAGNRRFLESRGISAEESDAERAQNTANTSISAQEKTYTPVYVASNSSYLGRILIGDTPKESAAEAISRLKEMGIQTGMFSGDTKHSAAEVASQLGINLVKAELLPEDKLEEIEKLARLGITVFVGDGINDAPVLARAHTGIAMGSGADVAVEAADVIVMTDEPLRIPEAIERARKTHRIITGNVLFALGAKGAFIALASLGIANMWIALIADVGVALAAILNSTRAFRP